VQFLCCGSVDRRIETLGTGNWELDNRANYHLAFNKIISMAFTWTNINVNYEIKRFGKDGDTSFTDIDFKEGTRDYEEINSYIKERITLTFDEPTFRAIIALDTNYQLDLTKSNFNKLIGFGKVILKNERNIGTTTPNMIEDTDLLNINCDLISDSLVDGEDSDIVFSFTTGTLTPSFNFTLKPERFFNPVNRTSIASIRIYVTDGLRRPVYLNHADRAVSLILKIVI